MAQSVEHIVHIDGVVGSSPTVTTKRKSLKINGFLAGCRLALLVEFEKRQGDDAALRNFHTLIILISFFSGSYSATLMLPSR